MAYIEVMLTKGKTALIDCADAPIALQYSWQFSDTGYAVSRGVINGKKQTVRLHRLIAQTPDGLVTDHKNNDRLDNRRRNLRVVTQKQNTQNHKYVKGYSWDDSKKKWMVRYKKQFYGRYDTESEAQRAFQLACSGVPSPKRTKRVNYHFPTGVFRNKHTKQYQAQIQINGIKHYLGVFPTVQEAERAYLNMKERI